MMQEIILIVAIFAGLACLIATFSRAVLLPTAKLGQRARGFSDQVVTEIAVALPLGLGILVFVTCLACLWVKMNSDFIHLGAALARMRRGACLRSNPEGELKRRLRGVVFRRWQETFRRWRHDQNETLWPSPKKVTGARPIQRSRLLRTLDKF